MKTFKKIFAVILAVITVMSLGVISSSAASTVPPKFELKIISQTKEEAVIELSILSGEFNSVDFELKPSSAISSIKTIITTDEFDKIAKQFKNSGNPVVESSSTTTGRISLASTETIKTATSIYDIYVKKATANDLVVGDLNVRIIECIVSNNNVEEKIAPKVTVSYVFNKVNITNESVELNYKASTTLGLDTNFAKDKIKWTSSNTSVATVDENGNVYAAGTGSATITAESEDGCIKDTCAVKVSYAWWQWIIVIVLFGWIWY